MNFTKLNGKKTYMLVAIGVIVYGAEQVGLIPTGVSDKIDGLLVILGVGTIRHALAKAAN